jgi:CheY-like chemotaxis protein
LVAPNRPSVLVVDDDRDVAELIQAILTDAGYPTSCLYTLEDNALLRATGRLEPDCVLLDGPAGPE